ncbi:MAG: NAD(P)H-binding protein [Streptomycetaceae bacterium]|nr:NAD(P)H-binding protein [Streptomycetaceae bacterium]
MLLITGATGTVGRPLVAALHAKGVRVRAVTRDPARASFPDGVEVVAGDPSRPGTLAGHFDGVEAVFVNPRAVRDAATEFAALARERGVRRLVALAASNVEQDLAFQPSRCVGDRNRECEAAVENSGVEWVSLRPTVYANMALPLWGGQLRAGDVVSWPYPDFADTVIDPRDVAEVAAHALTGDGLLGRKPVLSGPGPVTNAEMVAALGRVLDRPLRYREISATAFAEVIARMGLPPELTASFLARWAALEREPAEVSGEVEAVLGRRPRTFGAWAADHASAFDAG